MARGFVPTLLILSLVSGASLAYELKGLHLLANFFSGKLLETTLNPELLDDQPDTDEQTQFTFSNGHSAYTFVDFVRHADRQQCGLHDSALADGRRHGRRPAAGQPAAKPAQQPMRWQCRRGHGNGSMILIQSYRDMLHLIVPHGNVTAARRHLVSQQPGNCALLLFYSHTCYMSSKLAPQFNPLPALFPDLRVGAVDAMRFHALNTELGIVGLPTLMLFHQARPVMRFNGTLSMATTSYQTLADFVTEHTGIESRLRSAKGSGDGAAWGDGLFALRPEHFEGPLDGVLVVEADWCLWLAWLFIAVCGGCAFGRSSWYGAAVEFVKRNWRESVAQHER